jgi:hypothetical protein
MLREELNKELDKLDDQQLQKIADFIASPEFQFRQIAPVSPFWQRATSTERAREFREWALQLSKNNVSLPDGAFNRASIYSE